MSYPPIYVINLKRTPERKLHIQRELDALNLPYQFVDAIDKHDLHCSDYRRKLARQINIDENVITLIYKNLRIGAAACALSHIKVYNLMIEKNISVACILEDDGHILPTFPDVLAASQEVSWDVLMFAHQSKFARYITRKFHDDLRERKISRILHNLILLKKSHSQLNLYAIISVFLEIAKYMILHFFKYQNDVKQGHNTSRLFISGRSVTLRDSYFHYFACKLGALPGRDRSFQLKSTSNHYIAQPEKIAKNHPTSAMGYILTRSAAIQWKHQFISSPCLIDTIPYYLYKKENLNLYMVVPPCVTAVSNYLFHSARLK